MSELALTENTEIVRHHDPEAEVVWASECAKALVRVIDSQPGMRVKIGTSDYVKVEGWQVLGAMTKVDCVRVEWTREYRDPATGEAIGWEARVQVQDRDGNVRGEGEASCLRTEKNWKGRDDFALRSMAQTRAMGKAYRMALSYIVGLAGYQTTPAEEMPTYVAGSNATPAQVEALLGPESMEYGDPKRPPPSRPSTKKISEAQRKRLFAIAGEHNVPDDRVKEIVKLVGTVESTKDIPASLYDLVIEALEKQDAQF